jgi:hypothetical protein
LKTFLLPIFRLPAKVRFWVRQWLRQSPFKTAALLHKPSLAPRNAPSSSTILIDCQFGLANRLRALAAAAVLAETTGRRLQVAWEPDEHCECSLADLLDLEAMRIDVVPRASADKTNWPMHVNYTGLPFRLRRPIPSYGSVYITSPYRLRSRFADWGREGAWLRGMVNASDVRARLAKIDYPTGVGIHCRVLPPSRERITSDMERAPNRRRVAYIERVRRTTRVTSYMHAAQRIRQRDELVYFATDSDSTLQLAEQAFGADLRQQPKIPRDRSREATIAAFVDAWSLGRSRVLIGSNASAFTDLAHTLGGPSQRLLVNGVHFG